jgi:HEAT repeat protein
MRSTILKGAAVAIALIAAARTGDCQTSIPQTEPELIALLRSDATAADKALACKHLAIYGSGDAVPVLAPLLADEQLASWARIALEAIPSPAANEALRKAAESLQGRLLIGAINSLGVRRDAEAVELLVARLKNDDANVASAAALALGRIGNDAATKALRQALKGEPVAARSTIAEGCILCAERRLADGNAADAVAIYDEVRNADVPWQRMLEATRGAILARGDEGIPLLVEQIRSPHKGLFQIGVSTARELPGRAVDKALVAEVERATPERAAVLIVTMADRADTVDLPAVLKFAAAGPKPARIAAINALGRVGNASCLAPLLEVAVDADAEIAQAGKATLAVLPGEGIDRDIASRLGAAQGKLYQLLIELVGMRRIEATAALVKALDNTDPAVRHAALASLGATVKPQDLSVLIAQVVAPKSSEDAPAAQLALKTAAVRMPDREACAAELSASLLRSTTPIKVVLLDILTAVGGTKALQTVGASAKSSEPALQDAGSRLLGEWMTIDAAPVLLDLAKTGPANFQIRALRGYIRMARQLAPTEAQRAEMCRIAFETARQPAEQKLILETLRLRREPTLEMLKLAVNAAEIPAVKDEAVQAAQAIAQKLGNKDEVRQLMSKINAK